jgi:phosphoribosylaminoimidazole (AIR) synthetase
VEQRWRTAAAAGVSYKEAGVDIDAGEELVRRIGPACKATARSGVSAAAAERVSPACLLLLLNTARRAQCAFGAGSAY